MKRILKIGIALSTVILLGIGCEQKLPQIEKKDVIENISDSMNEAISKAVVAKNKDKIAEGELFAEAHENLLFDNVTASYLEEEGCKFIKVYSLVSYGKYNNENGNYIRVAGGEVVPTIITFSKNDDGTIDLINYQVPNPKKKYEKEIKKLFPEELQEEVLNISSEMKEQLKKEEVKYFN